MVESKLFKTKICLLYQRGRCTRQYCNFAHGDAELRRSFNGRQEYEGGRDLRERLDKMRSPLHNSPGRRDTKTRHSSHGDSPRSLGKRINTGKRKHLDGHSDYSGRMSDGIEGQIEDRRPTYSDAKIHIDEQLRETQSEIKMLEGDKRQLEMYLEDKVKEAESLSLKIQELEMQLSKEKEEGKRFTTKIKEFIKAHKRNLRLQEELKRSNAKLQKLGEQLDLDPAGTGNEDDSKIYASNDDITGGYVSPLYDDQIKFSPRRTRPRVILETQNASNQVNTVGAGTEISRSRGKRLPRPSGNHDQSSNSKKPEADDDAYNRGGTNRTADIASAEKYKASETVPPTGIAAHAIDEDVEVVETDDKTGVPPSRSQHIPFLPPPPPIPQNAYAQYKCDDINVDIDGVDEETVEVDIV